MMVHKHTAVASYAHFLPNMQIAKFAQVCLVRGLLAVEPELIVQRTDLATQMSNVECRMRLNIIRPQNFAFLHIPM